MFSAARWRLTLVFTAVLAVILLTAGVAIYLTTSSVLFARVDDDLEERAVRDLSQFVEEMGRGRGPGPGGDDFVPHTKTTGGYFYAIVTTDGEPFLSSANVDPDGLAPGSSLQTALDDGKAFASTESSEGESLRVYVLAAQDQNGDPVLAQIGRSTEPEHSALSQLRTVLLAVFGGALLPAALAGFVLSGRVLRPIKTAMDSQQTFIADASHELRTPVAVVRTNAELLRRHIASRPDPDPSGDEAAVDDIVSESERLGKMVDQMLTLAQADAGQMTLVRSAVSLDELAERVGRSMKALADARSINLETRTNDSVAVDGDPARLHELLVILVDNAIKYTDAGGNVLLTVNRTGKRATLEVADTGHGIPAEALAHIFDRFYRVDKARSRDSGGTGLGLAIARQIVDAHSGTIRMESEVGKGTKVTVELPA
jgi:two-component system, OmpR family, sensor histidine kinase CiaH